jgi:hypothetical protein
MACAWNATQCATELGEPMGVSPRTVRELTLAGSPSDKRSETSIEEIATCFRL